MAARPHGFGGRFAMNYLESPPTLAQIRENDADPIKGFHLYCNASGCGWQGYVTWDELTASYDLDRITIVDLGKLLHCEKWKEHPWYDGPVQVMPDRPSVGYRDPG